MQKHSTAVVPFAFESHQVRTITDEQGNPWFVLRDVLKAMGSSTRPSDAVESINQGLGKGVVADVPLQTPGGAQTVTIINESAVTYLLARSNTESGKKLNMFIHTEVLPSIRKTGNYSPNTKPIDPAKLAMSGVRLFGAIRKELVRIGISDNAAAISANQSVAKLIGFDFLETTGLLQLQAVNQESLTYTPTELGALIPPRRKRRGFLLH